MFIDTVAGSGAVAQFADEEAVIVYCPGEV
jgi:hypothetical protein